MKNTFFYTFIALLFLLSCKKEKCYRVTDESNKTFRLAEGDLEFNTYETGYRYTVKVLREQKILNREPYQDETNPPHYTVLEVLKKEKL